MKDLKKAYIQDYDHRHLMIYRINQRIVAKEYLPVWLQLKQDLHLQQQNEIGSKIRNVDELTPNIMMKSRHNKLDHMNTFTW